MREYGAYVQVYLSDEDFVALLRMLDACVMPLLLPGEVVDTGRRAL